MGNDAQLEQDLERKNTLDPESMEKNSHGAPCNILFKTSRLLGAVLGVMALELVRTSGR